MKNILVVGIMMVLLPKMYAQPEYARNSMSLMVLDFGDRHNGIIFSQFPSLQPPEKFFNNTLQHPVIPTAGSKRPVSAELPELLQYIPLITLSNCCRNRRWRSRFYQSGSTDRQMAVLT
ncbi:MAG: hypothetical protein U0V54_10705 [Saprospiraceae bacterium]